MHTRMHKHKQFGINMLWCTHTLKNCYTLSHKLIHICRLAHTHTHARMNTRIHTRMHACTHHTRHTTHSDTVTHTCPTHTKYTYAFTHTHTNIHNTRMHTNKQKHPYRMYAQHTQIRTQKQDKTKKLIYTHLKDND